MVQCQQKKYHNRNRGSGAIFCLQSHPAGRYLNDPILVLCDPDLARRLPNRDVVVMPTSMPRQLT